jgi:hypothetical protein
MKKDFLHLKSTEDRIPKCHGFGTLLLIVLKEHKREKFLGSNFEYYIFLWLVFGT